MKRKARINRTVKVQKTNQDRKAKNRRMDEHRCAACRSRQHEIGKTDLMLARLNRLTLMQNSSSNRHQDFLIGELEKSDALPTFGCGNLLPLLRRRLGANSAATNPKRTSESAKAIAVESAEFLDFKESIRVFSTRRTFSGIKTKLVFN
jgi:hypothetical protein